MPDFKVGARNVLYKFSRQRLTKTINQSYYRQLSHSKLTASIISFFSFSGGGSINYFI